MTNPFRAIDAWLMNYHEIKVVDEKELYRWLIDKDDSLGSILNPVPRGSLTSKDWPKDVVIEAYSKGPLEDFPQTGVDRPVVSERVKAKFQKAFPGIANYFEFQVKWRKKLVIPQRYFVCEWAAPPVDCVDLERSDVIWIMKGTEPVVHDPVLDKRRLPKDRVVSYVEHISFNSVAWEPMRALCIAEGFTGVQFEKLPVV